MLGYVQTSYVFLHENEEIILRVVSHLGAISDTRDLTTFHKIYEARISSIVFDENRASNGRAFQCILSTPNDSNTLHGGLTTNWLPDMFQGGHDRNIIPLIPTTAMSDDAKYNVTLSFRRHDSGFYCRRRFIDKASATVCHSMSRCRMRKMCRIDTLSRRWSEIKYEENFTSRGNPTCRFTESEKIMELFGATGQVWVSCLSLPWLTHIIRDDLTTLVSVCDRPRNACIIIKTENRRLGQLSRTSCEKNEATGVPCIFESLVKWTQRTWNLLAFC